MGGGPSNEECQQQVSTQLFQLVQSKQMFPEIGIDHSILQFSGLDSASALESHSAQLLDGLASKGPDFLKDLGSSLSELDRVPVAVGLGALIVSFILDLAISTFMKTQNNGEVLDVVRRVFAEEKASGVRDSIDEYIKRFRYNMQNPEELLEDTKRMEAQLSDGLTRLRNSMLIDKQMSSRSMKYWVNGAAFHLLMLVHVARIKMARSPVSEAELNRHVLSISSMAEHYRNDLQNLLGKYEAYKRTTIYTGLTVYRTGGGPAGVIAWYEGCGVYDVELGRNSGTTKFDRCSWFADSKCRDHGKPYLNYMFNNWSQLKELREYFPGVKQNLKEKIRQNSEFDIQTLIQQTTKQSN